MSLLTKKHDEDNFFIADIFDSLPFKDDLASMEHPIFTLSFKTDNKSLKYVNGKTTVSVYPSSEGLPSMMDKDFLLYCGSLVVANMRKGRKIEPEYLPPRTLRVTAHDYFKATNRDDSGKSYDYFSRTLIRLRGCTIETSIKTNGHKQLEGFGLLESYRVVESSRVKNRMVALEVTLSKWFYNSIIGLELLTINPLYFRIRKPLERRLYELARKHCGNQKSWFIGLESLFNKSGSKDRLAKFKAALKVIIQDDHIPDYQYKLDSKDKVTITNKNWKEPEKLDYMEDSAHKLLSKLRPQTIKNAQKIHDNSSTDWSLKEIALQFYQFTRKKGMPDDLNKAFIGFLKKKVTTYKKDSVTA